MRFRGGGIGHRYMRMVEPWLDQTGWGTVWPSLEDREPNPSSAGVNPLYTQGTQPTTYEGGNRGDSSDVSEMDEDMDDEDGEGNDPEQPEDDDDLDGEEEEEETEKGDKHIDPDEDEDEDEDADTDGHLGFVSL